MAAILTRLRRAQLLGRQARVKHLGSYCLFPEIPDDEPSHNAVLRWRQLPEYSQFTNEKCYDAVMKRSYEFMLDMMGYGDSLPGTEHFLHNRSLTFDEALAPIETREVPLAYTCLTVGDLRFNNSNLFPADVARTTQLLSEQALACKYRSVFVNRVFRELRSGYTALSGVQLRIIDKYLAEYRLNGQELKGKERQAHRKRVQQLMTAQKSFCDNVQRYDGAFRHTVDDYSLVATMPAHVRALMVAPGADPSAGPWTVTLSPLVYSAFLEHCTSGQHRHSVWCCYNTRCSTSDDRATSNRSLVEPIRESKHMLAAVLGFDDYAQLRIGSNMAGSVGRVQEMITTLMEGVLPSVRQDLVRLQDFAASRGEARPLQLCDLPYWRRLYREHTYSHCCQSVVRDHFDFEHCFRFLCELSGELFGVEFRDISASVERLHADVRCYSVWERGQQLSTLFVDPFCRPLKTRELYDGWVITTRPGSRLCNVRPICHLNLSLDCEEAGGGGGRACLDLSQLQTLFHRFGQALTALLCRAEYAQVFGSSGVELDAVAVPALVLRYWLTSATNLARLSRNRRTGQRLSTDFCQRLLDADTLMSSFQLCHQLYLSQLDLKLHTDNYQPWQDVQRAAFKHFMPFPMEPTYSLVTSYVDSLAAGGACGAYVPLWSQLVAADVWAAFDEVGRRGESMAPVGRQFRDSYLALGGSVPQAEVFRRFRGRDPSPDAFFRLYKLYNR